MFYNPILCGTVCLCYLLFTVSSQRAQKVFLLLLVALLLVAAAGYFAITLTDSTERTFFFGDTDAVTTALGAYSAYSLLSTIEYNCTDFAQYGLEEPVTTVTVRYTEEESTEVKSLVFEFGNINVEENNYSYVRVNGSDYVYGMSEYYAESVSVFEAEELKYQPEVTE